MRNGKLKSTGFTLVELLVVLAIIALLLTVATPRYFKNLERAKEETLRQDLHTMREAIDKYYGDKGEYPATLQKLVELKYISQIPVDPETEKSTTWIIDQAEPPDDGISNVHSGALGVSLDGSPFSDW